MCVQTQLLQCFRLTAPTPAWSRGSLTVILQVKQSKALFRAGWALSPCVHSRNVWFGASSWATYLVIGTMAVRNTWPRFLQQLLSWPATADMPMTPLDAPQGPLTNFSFPVTLLALLGPQLQKAHSLVMLLPLGLWP